MKHVRHLSAAACLGIVGAFGASAAGGVPALHEVAIDCRISSSNDGCEKTVSCPAGTTLRGARAACNLEQGWVSNEQLSSVKRGYIDVVRSSDHGDEGSCWVGTTHVADGHTAIAPSIGLVAVSVGCQEFDKNGGDCAVRGTLYCQ